jgi:hypothetical protein
MGPPQFGRAGCARILIPMQAEATARQHDAHWFRAGEWLTAAIRGAKAAPDQLTPLQTIHIKRLICLFECALRRLILLAALAIELERTPPRPRRSPPHDKAVRRSGARRTPIRLYAFGSRASHAHAAGSADPNAAHDKGPRKPRFHIGQADCLTQGSAPAHTSQTRRPYREATGATESLDIEEPPPELLPPELRLPLCVAKATAAPAAQGAATAPATPASPPAVMTKRQMLAYLAELAAVFADPSRAIRRAALVLARNQELAHQIAHVEFIRPKGVMRFSLRDYARVLLPLHTELRRAATERTHDTS